jgi:hypothetical protein
VFIHGDGAGNGTGGTGSGGCGAGVGGCPNAVVANIAATDAAKTNLPTKSNPSL